MENNSSQNTHNMDEFHLKSNSSFPLFSPLRESDLISKKCSSKSKEKELS